MDNKITSKRINDHLEYDWYKYLIILIVGIVLFYFIFSQINRTRDYEDVNIFVTCYDSGENGFASRVQREMNASTYDSARYGEAVLRSITFEPQDPLSETYGTMLQTHGMVSSDILIVGKSYLEGVGAGFVELTDELLNDYLLPKGLRDANDVVYDIEIDDLEYFTYVNGNYSRRMGIKVSDFGKMSGSGCVFETDWRKIPSYREKYEGQEENLPDDEFYLVINPDSASIGKFGRKAKDENAQALYLINRFLAYYRGDV